MKKEDLLNSANKVLGEAAQKAKQLSSEALKASKSLAGTARKTVKTEKLDYDISKKYREIGKVVYAAYEEEGSYAGVADEICEEINELFNQIIAIKLGDEAEVTEEEKEEIIEEVNKEIDEAEEAKEEEAEEAEEE